VFLTAEILAVLARISKTPLRVFEVGAIRPKGALSGARTYINKNTLAGV
jgi:hypothetical protein